MFERDVNKVLALLFKYIFDEEKLRKHLPDIFSILKNHFKEKETELFIVYLLSGSEISIHELRQTAEKIDKEGGELVMTTAMKLKKEGRLEGKLEGRLEVAQRMLEEGFDDAVIAKITGLSREEIERLHNN